MNTMQFKKRALAVLLAGLLMGGSASANDQVPGKAPANPILLVGGDVYTVTGAVIRGGHVLIDNGKIAAVGEGVPAKLPNKTQKIDVTGKRVYPGLFAVGSDLGLTEVSSVKATRDATETGTINPNVRAEVAINPDSDHIPVTRANGVLLNLTAPTGGLVSGTGAIIQLDGWTWEQMTLKSPAGMHIAWPRVGTKLAGGVDDEDSPRTPPADQAVKALDRLFDDARAYRAARAATTKPAADRPAHDADARLAAMQGVLDGSVPIYAWADDLRQIESAVAFAVRQKVKLVIVGGYDAPRCATLLKANQVPVVVLGTQRLPQRHDAAYDEAYTLPDRLRKAGVAYCIGYGGRGANLRNLPYHAGAAVAYGLPAEDALKSITIYPAKITGVADRVGSIEAGKDATLIVTNGDVLETATQLEQAWIAGRPVDLRSRHTNLRDKYEQKYK